MPRSSTVLALATALSAACRVPAEGAAREAPSVVYVLADDLGYGEVGCYGQTRIATPNIDRLATEGMRFTRHYAGSAVCAPSRCVLLTGMHTGHAIVRANWERGGWGPDEPEGQFPLPEGTATLAHLLKQRGYRTACIGKWGLGGPGTSGHPNRQGFDLFYGHLCQRVAHNYYPTHLWRNEERDVFEGNLWFSAHQRIDAPLADSAGYQERFAAETYAPDRMIEEALEFVRASRDTPFFLYFASPVPHAALQVPPEELDAYPPDWDEGPYLGERGYLPHPSPRRAYAAMVSRFDHDVGRLLDLLDELELSERTIVMFSSDNGPTFNGGTDSEFFESTAGLRGLKTTLDEGGIRVPFLVRWPRRVAAGAVSDRVSGFQDVLPTVLELIGGPTPPVDGISLAPTLTGSGEVREHEQLYWEYRTQQALLLGDWKAVRRSSKDGPGAIELYDLAQDPLQERDVAASHPEVVREVERRMQAAHVPSPDFPLVGIDPDGAR